MLLGRERCSPKWLCRLGRVSRTQTPSETPLLESWITLRASASWKDGPAASMMVSCSIGGLAAGHYRAGQGYMPTRYRPALARGETARQGEETQWKGMAMMASVCTAIGRLTFTPRDVSLPVGSDGSRPDRMAVWLFALCCCLTLEFNKPKHADFRASSVSARSA